MKPWAVLCDRTSDVRMLIGLTALQQSSYHFIQNKIKYCCLFPSNYFFHSTGFNSYAL